MAEETEFETVQRLESIFKRLDRSGNGRIDIQDLSAALKDLGMSLQYAEVILLSNYILYVIWLCNLRFIFCYRNF